MEQLSASHCNVPKRDRELLASTHQNLLKCLVTRSIASMAPFLSIAQVPETEIKAIMGHTISTHVHDVEAVSKNGCTLICVSSSTKSSGTQFEQEKTENLVYVLRGSSASAFEPFICVAKCGNEGCVLAYADDNEYLMDKVGGGNETTIIIQVKAMADEKKMYSLARFADLIIQILESGNKK